MGRAEDTIVPNDKDYNVEAQIANPGETPGGEKNHSRDNEPEVLHRQLKSRHASMLALGGAIGTGLIIASGGGLAQAGPVGLLIAFIFVGTLCFAMLACLGEMSAFLPHQTGFTGHATRFVGPSFGACTGFSYWLKYLLQTPAQFAACTVIMNYWLPSDRVNNGVWMAIFILITFCIQMMPVRFFGEFEFWCSTIKVVTLTGLMIMCLVIDAGGGPNHEYIGFRTWKRLPFVEYLVPGATGRFVGFWTALITAVYSYTGSEMIGIALGEMSNPRKNVTRAVRACFYRIVFLYCGSIFCIGLVVPANSKLLLEANKSSTNASASPFVVAANVAGIRVLPHIINAAALIFVLSAANSDIYVNSRTAFALAGEGNLPKIFGRTNRFGVPWVAVIFTSVFSSIGFTVCSKSAYSIFKYLVSAVTLVSTVVWMQIMWSHIRFMKACKLHGIERKQLPYANRMNPYMAWYGLVGTGLISITKGFTAFIKGFHVIPFVTNYVALPVIVLSYIFYAWRYGSWYTPIDQLDLSSEVRAMNEDQLEAEENDIPVKRSVWGWIKHAWNS